MKSPGPRSRPWCLRLTLALAAVCFLALSSAASGAEGQELRKAPAPSGKTAPTVTVRVVSIPLEEECPADDNEAMNAVRAFIDPETGELRAPTAEEAEALARAIAPRTRRAQAERTPTINASGLLSFEAGEELMQDVVVRTGADGKLVFLCTPRSETPRALTGPLAPRSTEAPKEEK